MRLQREESTRQSKRRSKLLVELSIGMIGLYGIFLGSVDHWQHIEGTKSMVIENGSVPGLMAVNDDKKSENRKELDWIEILF